MGQEFQVHLDALLNKPERSWGVVADHIMLIRTRLLDLGDSPVENREFAASLVQQAIEEFCHTGRILSKVSEASIFRSPFYVRCFLPLLLSPSAKEDKVQQALVKKMFK